MDKQFHEGYNIIERCTVEGSVFLIGENPHSDKPFAVWEYANKAFVHPGYFDTKLHAFSDFGHRVMVQADFHIRNPLPEKRKPPRAPER